MDVVEFSQSLGLGTRDGASSPLMRSLDRLTQFDLACALKPSAFAVRRNVPPVNRRHIHRLPDTLKREHANWVDAQLTETPIEHARRRARRMAFTLFEQGEDLDRVERTLLGIGFHPSVCRESAEWAHERHRMAFASLEVEPSVDLADHDTAA